MRVRKNACYIYQPAPIDRYDGKTDLKPGEVVRVIQPHGCPKPNTMNHCHVARADDPDKRLVGLVCCGSLQPRRKKKHVSHD